MDYRLLLGSCSCFSRKLLGINVYNLIEISCFLLTLVVKEMRVVDPNYAQGYNVMFSDGYPYLVLSQVSNIII